VRGAGYAAMVNFAVVPDISTATYHIDTNTADDPTLRESRLPLCGPPLVVGYRF
jgi:hypothetical protein